MKRFAIGFLGLLVACGGGVDSGATPGEGDAASTSLLDAANNVNNEAGSAEAGPDPCADAGVPPSTLECAGLYSDFASQTLSPNAKAYAPATPLWSDGAEKQRWIELPPGQQIDVSNPNEWTFPVGTKLFKQFTYQGVRVETRLFQKVSASPSYWVHATYHWKPDQSGTTISYGGTVPAGADGGTWVIPVPDDCDACHRGRAEHILGFEQVSLGLEGATGLTLLQLAIQGLVNPPLTEVNLRIGDDGTGLDAPALAWLHVNCGVTCHNQNENSEGYGAGMFLRLDPTLLNGSAPTSSWDPLRTTVGVLGVSGSIHGVPRIDPGDPAGSAIIQLTSERGTLQMPPIGTRFVDTTDVQVVSDWIQHLAPVRAGGVDAGTSDAATMTMQPSDAGISDAGPEPYEASAPVDATVPEAAAPVDATVVSDSATTDEASVDATPQSGPSEAAADSATGDEAEVDSGSSTSAADAGIDAEVPDEASTTDAAGAE